MFHPRSHSKVKKEKQVRKMLNEYWNDEEYELVKLEKPYQKGYKFRLILAERAIQSIPAKLLAKLMYIAQNYINVVYSSKKQPKWLKHYSVYTDTAEAWDMFHHGLFKVVGHNQYLLMPEGIRDMYDAVNKVNKRTGELYPTVYELKAEFRHFFRLQRRKNMIEYTKVPREGVESTKDRLHRKLWKEGEARYAIGNTAHSRLDDREWRIGASKRRDFRRSNEDDV